MGRTVADVATGLADERHALPPDLSGDSETAELGASSDHSLVSDFEDLIADGKTYFAAELAYQKSRAGFSANRLKWSVIYGAAAFGLLHLALIALTVGAVIALSPITGPWIATAIVVVLLVVSAGILLLRLRSKVDDIRSVFEGGEP